MWKNNIQFIIIYSHRFIITLIHLLKSSLWKFIIYLYMYLPVSSVPLTLLHGNIWCVWAWSEWTCRIGWAAHAPCWWGPGLLLGCRAAPGTGLAVRSAPALWRSSGLGARPCCPPLLQWTASSHHLLGGESRRHPKISRVAEILMV